MADKTVSISFDGSNGDVGTPSDVTITKKGSSKIEFDLTTVNMPTGASARIVGIEFPTVDGKVQPTGSGVTPGSVFDDANTITVDGTDHTVYGAQKSGSAKDLVLSDDDEIASGGTEEDYPYKVWVEYTSAAGDSGYYSSADPDIKNKPTT